MTQGQLISLRLQQPRRPLAHRGRKPIQSRTVGWSELSWLQCGAAAKSIAAQRARIDGVHGPPRRPARTHVPTAPSPLAVHISADEPRGPPLHCDGLVAAELRHLHQGRRAGRENQRSERPAGSPLGHQPTSSAATTMLLLRHTPSAAWASPWCRAEPRAPRRRAPPPGRTQSLGRRPGSKTSSRGASTAGGSGRQAAARARKEQARRALQPRPAALPSSRPGAMRHLPWGRPTPFPNSHQCLWWELPLHLPPCQSCMRASAGLWGASRAAEVHVPSIAAAAVAASPRLHAAQGHQTLWSIRTWLSTYPPAKHHAEGVCRHAPHDALYVQVAAAAGHKRHTSRKSAEDVQPQQHSVSPTLPLLGTCCLCQVGTTGLPAYPMLTSVGRLQGRSPAATVWPCVLRQALALAPRAAPAAAAVAVVQRPLQRPSRRQRLLWRRCH